jgi:hypothetical protein
MAASFAAHVVTHVGDLASPLRSARADLDGSIAADDLDRISDASGAWAAAQYDLRGEFLAAHSGTHGSLGFEAHPGFTAIVRHESDLVSGLRQRKALPQPPIPMTSTAGVRSQSGSPRTRTSSCTRRSGRRYADRPEA